MKHSDEFEDILHGALAEYRDAEPLAGLEDRVLCRLRLAADHRRKLLWRWSALAAAAAMLTIAVWLGVSARARHTPSPAAATHKPAPPAEPQRKPSVSAAAHRGAASSVPAVKTARTKQPHVSASSPRVSLQRAPRREEFPMPTPLTSSERSLLALAQTHPAALQGLQEQDIDKQIDIAPIAIEPLNENTRDYRGEN